MLRFECGIQTIASLCAELVFFFPPDYILSSRVKAKTKAKNQRQIRAGLEEPEQRDRKTLFETSKP
jgi:hypothetical protein